MGKTRRRHARHETWRDAREMSAREHVYHSERCRAKMVYKTRAKAKRAKRRRERRLGHRFQVYRCPY